MSYVVGSITFGPAPCKVIQFPSPTTNDGGKARIQRRRVDRNLSEPFTVEDLRMDHADPTDTAPCELCGQTGDCA